MPPVKLVSSDNEEFEVEKDVATRSVLVKNMLEGDPHTPLRPASRRSLAVYTHTATVLVVAIPASALANGSVPTTRREAV